MDDSEKHDIREGCHDRPSVPPAQAKDPKSDRNDTQGWPFTGRQVSPQRIATIIVAVIALVVGGTIVGVRYVVTWSALPEEIVQGYLTALSEGRAADAVSYGYQGATPTGSLPFLTDGVLAASLKVSPLTNISIGKAQITEDKYGVVADTATVAAKYDLGGRSISYTFGLHEVSNHWYLDQPYATVALSGDWTLNDEVGMALDGVPYNGNFVDLFPGTYSLSVTNPLVTMSGGIFTIPDLGDTTPMAHSPEIEVQASISLSDEGQRSAGEAAQALLTQCLNEKSILSACGFGDPTVSRLTPSTIQWAIKPADADLSTWKWKLVGNSAVPAHDYDLVVMERAKTFKGENYEWSAAVTGIRVDISDPDNLVAIV